MHADASCLLYFVLRFRIKYAISVFGGFDENFVVEELSFPICMIYLNFVLTAVWFQTDMYLQDIMGRDIKTNKS